ncbi:MAG: glutaredoxin family protein [Bacteroidota bacterium]
MSRFYFLFLLFSVFQTQAQVAVKISEVETDESITFNAFNTLEEPVEITFYLSEVVGMEFDGKPVVKLVEPGQTLEVITCKKTQPQIAFVYDYQQVLMPSKGYDEEDFKQYESGIVVFSKNGCTRCTYATDYLNRNKVDFTLLNISTSPAYAEYMWDKLHEQGHLGNRIQTPVIMVEGTVSHSHENLKQFVKDLK